MRLFTGFVLFCGLMAGSGSAQEQHPLFTGVFSNSIEGCQALKDGKPIEAEYLTDKEYVAIEQHCGFTTLQPISSSPEGWAATALCEVPGPDFSADVVGIASHEDGTLTVSFLSVEAFAAVHIDDSVGPDSEDESLPEEQPIDPDTTFYFCEGVSRELLTPTNGSP